ncbi:hypothetical protein WAI453_000359 [Rhynchosporium graminicola]
MLIIARITSSSTLPDPPRRLMIFRKEFSYIPVLRLPQKGPVVGLESAGVFPVSAGEDTLNGEAASSVTVTVTVVIAISVFAWLVGTGAAVRVGEPLDFGGVLESVPGMPTFGSPDICRPTFSSNCPAFTTFPGD